MEYRKGKENSNADALSRLPLQTHDFEPPIPAELVLTLRNLQDGPVDAAKIKVETDR